MSISIVFDFDRDMARKEEEPERRGTVKTEKLELFNQILIIQMVHWTLYPLALTFIGIAGNFKGEGRPAGVLWGICGLLAVFYLFLRERVNRFILFMLLHIGLAALFLLLPVQTIVERAICAACGVGYFIQSMMKRFRQEDNDKAFGFSPVAAVVVCVAAILFQHYQGRADWDFYYAMTLVSVFVMYLISSYIQQYLNFLKVNKSSAGSMPAAEMFRSGMGLVVLYAAFGAIVLILFTSFDWLESLWNGIKDGLFKVIRFLLSLFPQEQSVEDVVIPTVEPVAEGDFSGLPEPSESFVLWKILEIIAIIVFGCAFVCVVTLAVIKAVIFIRNRFLEGYGRRSRILKEEEQTDVREKCGLAKAASQDAAKHSLFGFLTPAQRIRRLYKRKILASAYELTEGGKENTPALSLLTARECGEKLMLPEMALIYEQTRYSDKEATPEMLRAMRLASRQS